MKKVYMIPAAKAVKTQKTSLIMTSGGKGTGDYYSKEISDVDAGKANDDDFWSTSK